MGNIYLAEKDTTKAIEAYEKGNEKATRSGIEKGVLLLHLGDLYWAKEKYGDAKRCYGEAIGLLDKERKDYKQLSDRSKVLDELVPYTDAVYLQDSLQALAAMPEEERNKAIDRVIDALKKKEREERKLQAQAEAEKAQSQNGGNINNTPATPTGNQQEKGLWYFYNQMAVNQGKTTFQRQWGKRENIDDWQRINKTVVGTVGSTSDVEELTDEQRDSIFAAEQLQDSLAQIADSVQNDPHKREYYLKQIPFTPEQIAESNNIITDGLHHAGVIFKDKLDNLPLGEKNLRRLADNYPDYENMDDVYYHLYLLYSRLNRPQTAESYVDMLKNKFPESKWTALLSDPYFKENARFGTHIEDSIYTATYEAFKKDRYNEVAGNVRVSETRFPLGANRDKFLFIGGLNKLNNGDAEGCLADMKTVVEKYPQSRISEMAGMIINGVNAGRRLRGGRFSLGDVWTRRNVVLNDNDTTKREAFSPDRLADFKFLLVYSPDSVDENKLLFEMAKFNFTHFVVRNFDIEIADLDGLHQMQLSGFRSFDEAYQYAREMYDTKTLAQLSAKAKAVIISDKNQKLLETYYSYKDYEDFYAKHFAPLTVSKRYLLSEPAEVATPRERDLEEEISSKAPTQDDIDDMMEGGTPVDTGFEIPSEDEAPASPTTVPNDETVIPNDDIAVPAEETAVPNNETIIIPNEEIDVPAEETTPAEPQTTVIETPQIPVETPDKPVDAQQGKPNKAPKKLTETPKEPVETPKKTVEVPQDKPVEPTTPAIEEDVFIFNDDETGVPQNNNTKTQPQNFDIEDEYYELDGF
jgi:tetratricopeptide (TPR) repeat protein